MSYVSGEGQASGSLDSSVSGGAGMTKASLKPKEHGAYAILAIPLLTAIAASGVTAVGFATAVAAVAGFIAHEPLLVMVGHRGQRAQRGTPGARWRLIVLLGIVAIAGGCAVIQGTRESRWVLLSCGCLAISSFAIAVVGKHRTLAGQLWGVAGLSSPCVPVLVSGDYPIQLAIQVWLAWVLGFASTTLAVHGVIAKQKRRSGPHDLRVGNAQPDPFPVCN